MDVGEILLRELERQKSRVGMSVMDVRKRHWGPGLRRSGGDAMKARILTTSTRRKDDEAATLT